MSPTCPEGQFLNTKTNKCKEPNWCNAFGVSSRESGPDYPNSRDMLLFSYPEYLFDDISTSEELEQYYPTMDFYKVSVRDSLRNKKEFRPILTEGFIEYVGKQEEVLYDAHIYYDGKKQTTNLCGLGGQIINAECEELPNCGVQVSPGIMGLCRCLHIKSGGPNDVGLIGL